MQEPARRIHILAGSRTPRDDSILVAATVHPVIFGAPRPKTGRPCEAGFLASGLSLSSAFPTLLGSVAIRMRARRLQLRGQPRCCTAFPTPCMSAGSCAIGRANATGGPSCKCGNTTHLAWVLALPATSALR